MNFDFIYSLGAFEKLREATPTFIIVCPLGTTELPLVGFNAI
jgi:hypothetical protein